jgi:hypothetical protein
MGNRGHLKPHFFEITLMQFVNILEIPLMRFLSISEMEFVAPESRLKQQEAITTTTVKRITATEHPELKKQLQTRQARGDSHPPLLYHQTGNRTRPKNAPNPLVIEARSLLAELLHATTREAAPAASAPGALLPLPLRGGLVELLHHLPEL